MEVISRRFNRSVVYYLSEETADEILVRLPVKSLLRFRAVCKRWCDTITSPSFIRNNFNRGSNKLNLLVYWVGELRKEYEDDNVPHDFSLFTGEYLERQEIPDHRLKLPGPVSDIVGPCNGIFCVKTTMNRMYLWNPAMKRLRPLAVSKYEIDQVGFGVDALTNEFKIVLIHHQRPLYSVYESSNGSWKNCRDENILDKFALVYHNLCGTTFLKGSYCWIKHHWGDTDSVVLAYDMCNEVLEDIVLPGEICNQPFLLNYHLSSRDVVLDLYEETLALFYYGPQVVDLWLMKEKGVWTKLLTVRRPSEFHDPCGLWMKKSIIFQSATEVLMHDSRYGSDRILGISDKDPNYSYVIVLSYKESLTPVTDAHNIQDYDTQSLVSDKCFNYPGLEDSYGDINLM